ncbi:MAG: type III secretion system inner membrane ring subunit SctD [Puniceicoccales bacterium]|jgi:type III secretion system YscD/HrpQ family protein|nr:type III secretion system inner membrane ring subunit SctD [Puniceicoccales bacterium]
MDSQETNQAENQASGNTVPQGPDNATTIDNSETTDDTETTDNSTTTDNVATTAGQLVLRVLSGPHNGAEIDLQETAIVIGKEAACDVVLIDPALNAQHIKVFVKNSKINLEVLNDAPVTVDGTHVTGITVLQSFRAVVIGSTLLSMGPNDVTWPTISADQKPTQETAVTPQDEPVPQQDSSPDTPPPNETSTVDDTRKAKIKKYAIAGGLPLAALLVVILTLLFSKKSNEPDNPTSTVSAHNKTTILNILQKNNVNPNNIILEDKQNTYDLTVYVETNTQKQNLQKALSPIPFKKLRIYSQENLLLQAREVLKKFKTISASRAVEFNSIALQGYLYAIDNLPNIKNQLFADVVGLKSIQTTLLSPDEVYDMASNLLTQYGLMGLLNIQTLESGLLVSGSVPTQNEPMWKEAQRALKNTFNGICHVLAHVAVLPPQSVKRSFFKSPIASVSIPTDGVPWIDLQNGERYFEGTTLPSSYVIQSITPSGIILNKNEESINFTLNEL